MKYLSVCSGIEAASVAWMPLGWTAVAHSEIDPFPCTVLRHHYPDVPNWGDMTKFREWPDATVDVLVGGTPCQSFSVAGLRKGLADPRGNLALTYLAILDRYRPAWCCWENVPGVLSADDGGALGAFLGGLAELGYGFAYRVLDAQYFGLAQRRARVFVVGHLGDWRRAAAVLFERESLSGHPPPRREAGQGAAPSLTVGTGGSCGHRYGQVGMEGSLVASAAFGGNNTAGPIDVATAVNAHGGPCGRMDFESETFIAHALRADGFDASEDGTGRGTPLVPEIAPCLTQNYGKQPDNSDTSAGPMLIAFRGKQAGEGELDLSPTLDGGGGGGYGAMTAIAFDTTQMTSAANRSNPKAGDPCHPLAAGGHPPAVAFNHQSGGDCRGLDPRETAQLQRCQVPAVAFQESQSGFREVRRLTPRECERLQGFPDDYTLIPYRGKPAADGPRYKALGNSMAVPVMAWIGRRIQLVEDVLA